MTRMSFYFVYFTIVEFMLTSLFPGTRDVCRERGADVEEHVPVGVLSFCYQ